jgi:glutamine amidotransferase
MSLAVVDSGGANISSVMHALKRLDVEPVFTADADTIRAADRVILPGVGSAGAAMEQLRKSGLDKVLPQLTQPVLGICLGMQLLFRHSTEEDTPLLEIIDDDIRRLPMVPGLRIPHMGWNAITIDREDELVAGLDGAWFYFVHSYAAPTGDWTLARSRHGLPFSAIVRQGNFMGAQFHPERSAISGARLLNNFLEMPCN